MNIDFLRSQYEENTKEGKKIKFKFRCILKVSEEERNLIIKYKVNDKMDWAIVPMLYSILDLEKGVEFEQPTVTGIIGWENKVIENVTAIKNYLIVAQQYGGEETKII